MTSAEILASDAAALAAATGLKIEVVDAEGRLYVRVADYPLPSGWSATSTPILIIADSQYPHSALDMFWTHPSVLRADGTVAQNADQLETYLQEQWRRFSWHGSSAGAPPPSPLLTHFAMIEDRLSIEAHA